MHIRTTVYRFHWSKRARSLFSNSLSETIRRTRHSIGYCPQKPIVLPFTDFSSGRMDPRGDRTRRESRFRRRCQSRHAGYKSDYRNIANVIFPASGCESSHIGDSMYWLLLGASWMKDGAVGPIDIPLTRIPFAKSLLYSKRTSGKSAKTLLRVNWKSIYDRKTILKKKEKEKKRCLYT